MLALVAVGLATTALSASAAVRMDGGPAQPDIAAAMASVPRIPGLDTPLAETYVAAKRAGDVAGTAAAREAGLTVSGGLVTVMVSSSDPSAARDAVEAVGGDVDSVAGIYTRAHAEPLQLAKLAAQPGVDLVAQPFVPVPLSVTDEAVVATHASALHSAGKNGAGVKIAIVDVGFGGLAAAQASSDAPAVTNDHTCADNSSTHGTAVLSAVYKMAPGAAYFTYCVADQNDLVAAKNDAIAKGIKIVVHAVGWPATSRGDDSDVKNPAGTPVDTVKAARAAGIAWINAAGDAAQDHWSGIWARSGNNHSNLEFAPGDTSNSFTLDAGKSFCAALKWDDWPTSSNDRNFDLFVFVGARLFSSNTTQSGTEPPYEHACGTNTTGSPVQANLYIGYTPRDGQPADPPGTATRPFDLFVTGDAGPLEYNVAAGSIIEPATSDSAVAVGATCWQNNALEPYSSRGPVPPPPPAAPKPDIAARLHPTSPGAFSACGTPGSPERPPPPPTWPAQRRCGRRREDAQRELGRRTRSTRSSRTTRAAPGSRTRPVRSIQLPVSIRSSARSRRPRPGRLAGDDHRPALAGTARSRSTARPARDADERTDPRSRPCRPAKTGTLVVSRPDGGSKESIGKTFTVTPKVNGFRPPRASPIRRSRSRATTSGRQPGEPQHGRQVQRRPRHVPCGRRRTSLRRFPAPRRAARSR